MTTDQKTHHQSLVLVASNPLFSLSSMTLSKRTVGSYHSPPPLHVRLMKKAVHERGLRVGSSDQLLMPIYRFTGGNVGLAFPAFRCLTMPEKVCRPEAGLKKMACSCILCMSRPSERVRANSGLWRNPSMGRPLPCVRESILCLSGEVKTGLRGYK